MTKTQPAIVIDTREQLPYTFDGLPTVLATLKSGDYSLAGFEHRIAVERKSHADLWGSMTSGRARFQRCCERLSQLERAAIVIECSMAEACERPSYIQRTNPASVVGGLISWSAQYRLPVFFCDNRAFAERVTLRYLIAFAKHLTKQPNGELVIRKD